MPRTGPRRDLVATKLHGDEIAALDARALEEGLTIRNGEPNRSELMRRLLAYGMVYMPKGWSPPSP